MSAIIFSCSAIIAWHFASIAGAGFALVAAACWCAGGVCAASPGTADITTATQPATIAETIFFMLTIDSFRVNELNL